MKSNIQEEIIDLNELLLSPAAARSVEPPAPAPPAENHPTISERHTATNAQAASTSLPLRDGLQQLTDELRHLLKYLELIETGITRDGDLQKTVIIFRLIHDRAVTLIERMNALAAQAGPRHQTLWSALDTTAFALKHELRRVYEVETTGLSKPGSARHSRADLIRAYGLLQNCFQQSVITLAQVLNPTLDGEALLEEYKIKREMSLLLHRELKLLLKKVAGVQQEAGVLQMLNVINSLKRFQQEVMHLLMYRDWEEFEGFVDEVLKTYDELGNIQPVLHRFASYLETLLKHVSMRAVLGDKKFAPY